MLDTASAVEQSAEPTAASERDTADARDYDRRELTPTIARPARVAPTRPVDGGPSIEYDELPDGVVIADRDGRVVVFNRAAVRITGIDAASALGRRLADALPLEDLEGCNWWRRTDPYGGLAIRSGQPETHLLLPGGRDVLVTARFVRENGSVRRVVVGLRDTSARARAERRHADLIATVAHELRSPLTSVKGFTATLLAKWERFTDDQRKLMLETVDADADRVTRLIAELLDIARIDSGRLQLARYAVDLEELIREQINGAVAAGQREDRFVVSVTAHPAPPVFADPDKLRQVLANLLENAVRHGGGRISITLDGPEPPQHPAPDAAPALVAVTVDDEGPGIPPEMLGRVFTRFWRGNRRGGTGLGLYIVKGIIEAHGGTITVGAAPTGGARFRFTVPVA
ncbi:PAS domain-containing protein [Actinocrinis puniceicyclus]|uniref:histidine kinase n=1 Tax=Actinocrinis puniceicyclus TaxID=977794 RepID=A0A8J7WUW5_9ACTN|nr:ATP-binding protein [Actinocrinis puniceicyclus]MBS2965599.1 PAS domain-containing protein [Actinocrinis puniceicyclus]